MSMHHIQTENAQKTRNERAILCQMSYYDSKGDNLQTGCDVFFNSRLNVVQSRCKSI